MVELDQRSHITAVDWCVCVCQMFPQILAVFAETQSSCDRHTRTEAAILSHLLILLQYNKDLMQEL